MKRLLESPRSLLKIPTRQLPASLKTFVLENRCICLNNDQWQHRTLSRKIRTHPQCIINRSSGPVSKGYNYGCDM